VSPAAMGLLTDLINPNQRDNLDIGNHYIDNEYVIMDAPCVRQVAA